MHFASVIIFSAGEILSDCVLCSSGVFFFKAKSCSQPT